MAGGVGRGVGVVQIGHLSIPILRADTARVRVSDESSVAPNRELRLKDVSGVQRATALGNGTLVHEKHGDRSRPGGDARGERRAGQVSLEEVQSKTAGVRNTELELPRFARNRQMHNLAPWRPLPAGER